MYIYIKIRLLKYAKLYTMIVIITFKIDINR